MKSFRRCAQQQARTANQPRKVSTNGDATGSRVSTMPIVMHTRVAVFLSIVGL